MPTFDLHKLGWHSFQRLCLTIAREILGQTVQSFLDSNDGGRDGAFSGSWTPRTGAPLDGQFVIQCKFTSRPGYVLQLSDVSEEIAKAARLVQRGRCDVYILLTNAGLSGRFEEGFASQLSASGVKTILAYGPDWICQQIQENKRLRMLVPRVYGLGDLSQILDERAYDQARALLASIHDDLARVVLTDAYSKAAKAIDKHGFVLLLGEPASGKTTIASMLAMAALDQWNASTLKLDQPSELIEHWNPNEPSQFFWLDDAFGVTQYEPLLVHAWNHVFAQVRAMLRGGAKVIMTSRDYIYNTARNDLKHTAFPLLAESQVVIDVHSLTPEEKRQILYNHIKLGRQPQHFRSAIKPYLGQVASHPRFIPETARRLGDPAFTQNLSLHRSGAIDFVENQRAFLLDVLKGLDPDSRAALALIFMRNGAVESPIRLGATESEALQRLGSTLGRCATALDAMRGSLVKHTISEGIATWRFRHPTIGDAYAELLLASPELLGIYLHGAPTAKLLAQVTCGDVGLENAVIAPRSLFSAVLHRLQNARLEPRNRYGWDGRSRVDLFLAHRCDRDFLQLYLTEHPDTLDRVANPGLYLGGVTEVPVAIRLFKVGLLSESFRLTFVEKVSQYTVEVGDPAALTMQGIQEMFREAEWSALRGRIREQLVPALGKIRCAYQDECGSDRDPEDALGMFYELCDGLEQEFSEECAVVGAVQQERGLAMTWIEEERGSRPGEPDYDDDWPGGGVAQHSPALRDIFDDIDE